MGLAGHRGRGEGGGFDLAFVGRQAAAVSLFDLFVVFPLNSSQFLSIIVVLSAPDKEGHRQ